MTTYNTVDLYGQMYQCTSCMQYFSAGQAHYCMGSSHPNFPKPEPIKVIVEPFTLLPQEPSLREQATALTRRVAEGDYTAEAAEIAAKSLETILQTLGNIEEAERRHAELREMVKFQLDTLAALLYIEDRIHAKDEQ